MNNNYSSTKMKKVLNGLSHEKISAKKFSRIIQNYVDIHTSGTSDGA
jgi:flagellar biosynthesis component FlhA